MITTTLKELLDHCLITLEDEDPGVFESYEVVDGYVILAELEPGTWGETPIIQRVLDDKHPDHLIFIDSHGNSTNIGSDTANIRLYQELDSCARVGFVEFGNYTIMPQSSHGHTIIPQ